MAAFDDLSSKLAITMIVESLLNFEYEDSYYMAVRDTPNGRQRAMVFPPELLGNDLFALALSATSNKSFIANKGIFEFVEEVNSKKDQNGFFYSLVFDEADKNKHCLTASFTFVDDELLSNNGFSVVERILVQLDANNLDALSFIEDNYL